MERLWIKEFIDYCNSWRREEAWNIRQKNMPDKIFRYRAVSEHSLKDLKNDTVWLSSPDKYNDPYDSTRTVNVERLLATRLADSEDFSDEEIEKIKKSSDPISTLFQLKFRKDIRRPDEMSEDKYEELVEQVIIIVKKTTGQIIERISKQILSLSRDRIKLCSFSETKSSIIMWAHYAKNHEGFCIEYDLASLDKHDDRRESLVPVIYSDKLCDATHLVDLAIELGLTANPDTLRALKETLIAKINDPIPSDEAQAVLEKVKVGDLFHFIYKSREWAYEREWRLHEVAETSTPDRSYVMPTPSAIYLGARMKERNKKRICNIAVSKNIDVYQMNLSGLEFKLLEEKIGDKVPESFLETEEWKLFKEKLKTDFPEIQVD